MTADRIEHVIVLMLENRSFDHLLGFLRHPDPSFPSLEQLNVSCPVDPDDPASERVPPTPDANPVLGVDPGHSHEAVLVQLGGPPPAMDGFIRSYADKLAGKSPRPPAGPLKRALKWLVRQAIGIWHRIKPPPKPVIPEAAAIMRCFPEDEAPVLSRLAKDFAVLVNWFASVPGETWPNRNFAHAATSDGTTNIEIRFYDNETIFEQLDEQGATWSIYHDGIAQVWAFWRLWIADRSRFHGNDVLLDDIRNDRLPAYAFVEPNHGILGGEGNSQHPSNNTTSGDSFLGGEALTAGIYNALVETPAVFAKTLLLITYDEHGGFYDHVPPKTVPPETTTDGFDFGITGVRVPAVAISPLIPHGTVVTDFCEHASIPATVRARFASGAQPLTARDAAATDFLAALPLRSEPRTDCTTIPPRLHIAEIPEVPEPAAAQRLNDFQASLVELAGAVKTRIEQPTVTETVGTPAFQPDPTLAGAARARIVPPGSPASQAIDEVLGHFAD